MADALAHRKMRKKLLTKSNFVSSPMVVKACQALFIFTLLA
jgi:hypothetical protein